MNDEQERMLFGKAHYEVSFSGFIHGENTTKTGNLKYCPDR